MELYLIRHGIAHPLGQRNEFTDEKRALTSQGRERMREVGRGLRKLGVKLDLILTSPLVRADETAGIVADALGMDKGAVGQTANLAPQGSFEELMAELKQQKSAESVALVGHEPYLSSLLSRIISGDCNVGIPLKKGGVCCVDVVETVPTLRGTLRWLLTPRQMRLLAKS